MDRFQAIKNSAERLASYAERLDRFRDTHPWKTDTYVKMVDQEEQRLAYHMELLKRDHDV